MRSGRRRRRRIRYGRESVRVRISIRIWARLLRVKRRITAEHDAQISGQIGQIGGRIDPVLEVREGDKAGGVDVGMRAFDDHLARGIDIDARRLPRVSLHEPDDDRDMVRDLKVHHRDGARNLEKIDGAAVVVGVGGGLWSKRREGIEKGNNVLSDHPFDVLGVRHGRRTSPEEYGGQELMRAMWRSRR